MSDIPEDDDVGIALGEQAAHQAASEFKHGDLVPYTWLDPLIDGVVNDNMLWGQAQKIRLRRISETEAFKKVLSDQYLMEVDAVPGKGYRILPPEEQAGSAVELLVDGYRKLARKASRRLHNVDMQGMDNHARKRLVNAELTLGRVNDSVGSVTKRGVTIDMLLDNGD